MPAVSRITDNCTGHTGCPPRPADQGSDNVFVNNLNCHRQTDSWVTHCDHPGNLTSGSSTVFVNNLQCSRIGDPVNEGSVVAQGSSNVFAGG